MFIRKCMCVLLAFGTVLALGACSKSAHQSQPDTAATHHQNSASSVASLANSATNQDPSAQKTAGAKLIQLNLKDGESPIIRSAALDGNRAGKSIEEGGNHVNGRPISDNNIRSIFELNEWISIRLDTAQKSGIIAAIIPHVEDDSKLAENLELPDAAPRVELNAPDTSDNPMASWGEMYLHPDDWQPGAYDLVFLSGNKPIARVLLKFYPEKDLENQTDAQLEKLMQNQ